MFWLMISISNSFASWRRSPAKSQCFHMFLACRFLHPPIRACSKQNTRDLSHRPGMLKSHFCKTDTPEIYDPPWIAWLLAQVCIMTRNACPRNFSFLAHLLSKLQHLKKCFNIRPHCGFYDQRIFKWHGHVFIITFLTVLPLDLLTTRNFLRKCVFGVRSVLISGCS